MKKILVIDDEDQMRLMLEDLLNSEYDVSLAANGSKAQEMLATTSYDLIITDLVMPEMNGIDLIMSVKHKKPDQKVIAISGGGGVSGRFDYLPVVQLLGADKIFNKPFHLHELMAAVKLILD